MTWINLGDMAYVVKRHAGSDRARRFVRELRQRPTLDVPAESRDLESPA